MWSMTDVYTLFGNLRSVVPLSTMVFGKLYWKQKSMTFSDEEIRMSTISLSRLKERKRMRERKLLRTRKKYKQNFCVRKSGNDYFHHDGNEFSVPLYSPGWCSLHWPVHPQWRPHNTTFCVCWWRTQVHCVAWDPLLQMSTVNMEIHVNTSIFIYSRTSLSPRIILLKWLFMLVFKHAFYSQTICMGIKYRCMIYHT